MLSPWKVIFAFFKRIVGWHDTEGYASLHPRLRATRSARAFDLSGRAAVKQVMISLSEVVLLGMMTTPHRSLRSVQPSAMAYRTKKHSHLGSGGYCCVGYSVGFQRSGSRSR